MSPTTIVLADDHRIVREGIRKLLETRADYEIVGEAGDGEEAVALVSKHQPDVALMDINMPGVSGIEATRQIGRRDLNTRVLALSIHESKNCVREALQAGASGYVVKNASPTELLAAIDAIREGRSYLSNAITQQVVDAIVEPGGEKVTGLSLLTDREREVLQYIAEGLSSKEIAGQLGVSLKTVDSHRSNLMEKLDIHKVAGLVKFAVRAGLVEA